MKEAALTILVLALLFVGYTVVGYPLVLRSLQPLKRRPRGAAPDRARADLPFITITAAAYNEERQITHFLESLLAIDYPEDKRQILIVSDASTDRTDDIVRTYAHRGVELLRTAVRGGKTAAENTARPFIRGQIVVNTDASSRVAATAVRRLVDALRDPSVGVASGRDVSLSRRNRDANAAESGFVGYEMWIRRLETTIDGIVGASGCLYAIRSHLHQYDMPEGMSRDFGAALVAREQGFRTVSVDDAICYVPRAESLRREFQRKVRTMTRGLHTLVYKRTLLDPRRFGLFSWMLFSHKVCRWLLPFALMAAVAAALALAPAEAWARWFVAGALVILALAALGWIWPEDRILPRAVAAPAFFVAGNVAGLVALLRAFRGGGAPIWEPTRRELTDVPPI